MFGLLKRKLEPVTSPSLEGPVTVACNICGSVEFADVNGRKGVLCARCGSYERTRLMKLFIEALRLGPKTRVLHLAPERGLSVWLSQQFRDYVPADYDLPRYSHIPGIVKVDLCQRDYGLSGKFDLILHSHVIEHLPINYAVVLIRLHKMLARDGRHMFSVPIYGKSYEESLATLSAEEATRRFGQFDHVRRFSPVDIGSTIGSVFDIPEQYDLLEHFSEAQLRAASVPEDAWKTYTGNSVFCLKPGDLLV
ncbi:SAM-dependent methyltransferase [Agrilutibacter solisilvae]|uniref:Methyltransferase domain-containing protein n=1 Tax=Agrilutibacter solisilvae TaxID=2763317 RepID=A0A974Y1R7_9GAMM|nr:methyltransferase domain-containing protein [Lysobacter solisilvae]QSX79648.1 methyltransferase domain-containing protein [Lysobacter solisilvae]